MLSNDIYLLEKETDDGLFWFLLSEEQQWKCVVSYPGLLTPAFVACSTNMGKAWCKTQSCADDVPGCVEEWHIPSVQL